MMVRHAIRALLRSPLFTMTAVAITALTICLPTAVFAIVDGVLFKGVPYPGADRLFTILGSTSRDAEESGGSLSSIDLQYLRDVDAAIDITSFSRGSIINLVAQPDVELWTGAVDSQFFDVFGQHPLIGGFTREHYSGRPSVAVPVPALVSYSFWRTRLNGDRAAVGRVIETLTNKLLVVGILPGDFVFPEFGEQPQIILPLYVSPSMAQDRWARRLSAIAKVPPDVDEASVKERFDVALSARSSEYQPTLVEQSPYIGVSLQLVNTHLRRDQRPLFAAAFASCCLLVLLGALNVGSMVWTRVEGRQGELKTRAALGATRAHLVSVILLEWVVVVCIGGLVGLSMAPPFLQVLVALLPPNIVLLKPPVVDWRAVLFSTSVAVITVIVCISIATIRSATRTSIRPTGVKSGGASRGRALIVAAESAIGMLLVLVGSLLVANVLLLRNQDFGFDVEQLGIVELRTVGLQSKGIQERLEVDAIARIKTVPGVQDVALLHIPLLRQIGSGSRFERPKGARRLLAAADVPVSATFFKVAGVVPLQGRLLTAHEIETRQPTALVSERLARAFWPGKPAIGQSLTAPNQEPVTVVGVVREARLTASDEELIGEIYIPRGSTGANLWTTYLIRSDSPTTVVAQASHSLRALYPSVVVQRAESAHDAISRTLVEQRFRALLLVIAAGAALAILAVGIASTAALRVARASREIGLRVALGAHPGRVVVRVLLNNMRPVCAGMFIGLGASLWTAMLVKPFLHNMSPYNPFVWSAAAGTMVFVALLASSTAALRAASTNPAETLKAE